MVHRECITGAGTGARRNNNSPASHRACTPPTRCCITFVQGRSTPLATPAMDLTAPACPFFGNLDPDSSTSQSANSPSSVPAHAPGFCAAITEVEIAPGLSHFEFWTGISQFILLSLVLYRQRSVTVRLQQQRRRGSRSAGATSEQLILPHYLVFLYAMNVLTFITGLTTTVLPLTTDAGLASGFRAAKTSQASALLTSISWGLYHFVLDGVGFILTRPGIGSRTFSCLFKYLAVWALVTALSQWLRQSCQPGWLAWIPMLLWELFCLACYGCMWLLPQHVWPRRPAAIKFASFNSVIRTGGALGLTLSMWKIDAGICVRLGIEWLVFCLGVPWILYHCFTVDGRWWLGLAQPKRSRNSLSQNGLSDIRAPLIQLDGVSSTSAVAIARGVNSFVDNSVETGIRTESSAQGRNAALLIPFQELSLNMTAPMLGAGGTARVFQGALGGDVVAVKILFCPELTRSIIQSFFGEASQLAYFNFHPNVVELRGVCVAPPSLGLVLDKCTGGLDTVISARRAAGGWESPVEQIDIMLQCCRSILALHRVRNPSPVCHRDIKSMNFLYKKNPTGNIIVKLADLGLSRTSTYLQLAALGDVFNDEDPDEYEGTPRWTAPEIFDGETYATSADIFSLSVTLWEISSFMYPFESIRRNQQVIAACKRGDRPDLDVVSLVGLQPILEAAWSADPQQRPSAEQLIRQISMLLPRRERAMAALVGAVDWVIHPTTRAIRDRTYHTKLYHQCAIGSELVDLWVACDVLPAVSARRDALRLGRLLAKIGIVDHVVSEHDFEDAYLFYHVTPLASLYELAARLEQQMGSECDLDWLLAEEGGQREGKH